MSSELEGLKEIASELYSEGYQSGSLNDDWIEAYARAMKAVADGEPYSKKLVDIEFEKIQSAKEAP